MYGGQQPIIVLKEGTQREKGKNAQGSNIAAAKAIADAVRTTLGPKGMDKMLVDGMGDVVITNDGATILKEIDVEHPAAKMIIEVAKTQDEECGDGTTSAVVIAGELLKKCEDLIENNVHPTTITSGFRKAAAEAQKILKEISKDVTTEDTETLKNIARTAMTGKIAENVGEILSEIAVGATKAVVEENDGKLTADIDNIKIEKKQGGSLSDTNLINGIVLDKERVHGGMPRVVENTKIALIDAALEVKKTEMDAKINITSPEQMQAFLAEEEKMLKDMADKIINSGANVVVAQKGIDDLVQYYLAKNGVYAVRRAKKSDMEKLARATGATIISNIKELDASFLGTAEKVEEKKIAGDEMTFITGCKNPKAVTILVRGGTEHVVDEIERALHDALGVVSSAIEDGKIAVGGGASAIELSSKLEKFAETVEGREQLAVKAFASALEVIPKTLAENAGLDPIEVLLNLKKEHAEGNKFAGINVYTGEIIDMMNSNVIEPLRVGANAISSAADVATMILRIDDVIASRKSDMPAGAGGMPPGGMDGMGY